MSTAVVAKFYAVYHNHQVDLLDELLAPQYIGRVNGLSLIHI